MMQKILFTIVTYFLLLTFFTYAAKVKLDHNSSKYSKKQLFFAGDEVIAYDGNPFICDAGNKLLTASNAPSNATFQWYKNNVAIPNANGSNYTVTETGEYSVMVTSGEVSKTYPKVKIEKLAVPEARFSQPADGNCSASRQFFTNQSIGDILTYVWDFGDPNAGAGNTSTNENGRHFFIGTTGNGSQTFTVTLTATNRAGCSSSVQHEITLRKSPNANLSANNSLPEAFNGLFYFKDCSNQATTFTFKNLSNTANIMYDIDWGDNDPAQPRFRNANFTQVTHTYKPGKIHQISYTVTGANGCFNNRVYQIMVGQKPTIAFGDFNNSINTGDEISIPVIGASNNTVGTFYRVDYSDAVVQRSQLPLTEVKRLFPSGSFGKSTTINNIIYPNAYSAFIKAYNVCNESPRYFSKPIYVSDKQPARFISSPASICMNEVKSFSYTEPIGNSVTKQGVGYKNRLLWQVTPNSGYEVVEGDLGSTNNTTDPLSWTTGSTNLSLKFINNGTYTVKLVTGTVNLIETSPSTQIEVKALPSVYKPADQNLCNAKTCDRVQFSGAIPNTVYKWTNTNTSIGLADSGTGDISGFSPVNNGNEPAIATITVTPYLNDCIGNSESFTMTVSPTLSKPIAPSTVNYCVGSIATALSATGTVSNVLKWYDDENLIHGSDIAPTPATNTVGTTYYYITQQNINGCESPASKIEVIVNPVIVNNVINENQSLCYNTDANPLAQASGDASGGNSNFKFQWQSSNDGVTWTNILDATQKTYSPGKLTSTRKYRRKVSSGSCEDLSNIITIDVQNNITNFEIANDQQLIEPRRVPREIAGQRAQGGNGTFTYQWETSSGNNTWTLITGATSQNYQPLGLLETTTFRRIAKSGICSVTSSAITITVYSGIKNTFTPNGDGINDTWDISGFTASPNTQVKVYNRLGQVVFDAHNQTTWNGEFQGSKLPMGVYYYLITQNNEKPVKGWVSIIY